MTYQQWLDMSLEERLMYVYYEAVKSTKQEYEIKKSKEQQHQSNTFGR